MKVPNIVDKTGVFASPSNLDAGVSKPPFLGAVPRENLRLFRNSEES